MGPPVKLIYYKWLDPQETLLQKAQLLDAKSRSSQQNQRNSNKTMEDVFA